MEFKDALQIVTEEISEMLLEKNRKYGSSMFDKVNCFHKGDRIDAINARIDDKLKRKAQDVNDEDEDIELDLLGYLIAKRIIIKNLM